MGDEKQKDRHENTGNETRFGGDNKNTGCYIEKTYGVEKTDLIRKILSLKSEDARLHLEYVFLEESIVNNLMRLSGLISESRIKEKTENLNGLINRFSFLFDKYMKKS